MRIMTWKTIRNWQEEHPKAKAALQEFAEVVEVATWAIPQDVKSTFRSADLVTTAPGAMPDGLTRVVFDIKGNHYRLIAHLRFSSGMFYCKWFGTHAEYDEIDVEKAKFE